MDDIVETALSQAEQDHETVDAARTFGDPEIVAIGCGDAGISAAEAINRRTGSVTTVAVGVERDGETAPPGTNFHFELAQETSEQVLEGGFEHGSEIGSTVAQQLDDALDRADLCFVLGRLTEPGSLSAAAVTATAVNGSSAIGIAVATISTAAGVDERDVPNPREVLSAFDLTTLIDTERLRRTPGQSGDAFDDVSTTPQELGARFVINAAATIVEPSLINLDYADLTSIFQKGNIGTLASVSIANPDHAKVETYSQSALQNPLYPIERDSVRGCWVHLTGGPGLTLKTAETLASRIVDQPEVADSAVAIWSARIVDEFEQFLQVETLLTGPREEHSPILARK